MVLMLLATVLVGVMIASAAKCPPSCLDKTHCDGGVCPGYIPDAPWATHCDGGFHGPRCEYLCADFLCSTCSADGSECRHNERRPMQQCRASVLLAPGSKAHVSPASMLMRTEATEAETFSSDSIELIVSGDSSDFDRVKSIATDASTDEDAIDLEYL
ncbi:MAG: hypothetical protein MHM6MM_005934 [Cercozoa sp. M6MM]